ncbi:MAG: S-methyl-5-thioribose-1-phosphate isomerase [Gemmataceae bacterium]
MSGTTVSQHPTTIEWIGDIDGYVRLIDQTQLPTQEVYKDCRTVEEVWEAIKMLRVRGAPAIGIAAAMGVVVGMQSIGDDNAEKFTDRLKEVTDYLATSRPTAVNLFWALDRMNEHIADEIGKRTPTELRRMLMEEAIVIEEEDRQTCLAIGQHGASLIGEGQGVLTHCNAGALATADYGTALSVMFAAAREGRTFQVFADETRPLLQGSRLTAWELQKRGVDVTLICDNMAAQVMKEGKINVVITGADRIAANGDSANKIGTYGVALLAKAHSIPFYIAAPLSTFDMSLASGDQIPIEERAANEITHGFGKQTAPNDVKVYNPAFDVTPAELIAGIVTEHGIIQPVNEAKVREMFDAHNK